ncbi:hypothetical protein LXL04_002432 [Taraxacum kok-saghyz]
MHGGFGKLKFDSPENLGVDVAQNGEELVDKEFADEEELNNMRNSSLKNKAKLCVHECQMGDVISTGDQSEMREDGGGISNRTIIGIENGGTNMYGSNENNILKRERENKRGASIISGGVFTTAPPPSPTGPPSAPTGPPSNHCRTTNGPLSVHHLHPSDHCRTTAGPPSVHHQTMRTTKFSFQSSLSISCRRLPDLGDADAERETLTLMSRDVDDDADEGDADADLVTISFRSKKKRWFGKSKGVGDGSRKGEEVRDGSDEKRV